MKIQNSKHALTKNEVRWRLQDQGVDPAKADMSNVDVMSRQKQVNKRNTCCSLVVWCTILHTVELCALFNQHTQL